LADDAAAGTVMRRVAVAMCALAWLCAAPSRAAAPDTSGIGFDQRLGHTLPLDARFTEADGRAVTLGDLVHGPALLLLGYFHCPSLCGIARDDALTALSASGLVAGRDYTLLDASIDPAETPADAAKALADDWARLGAPGAAQGWHFLTGGAGSIGALQRAVGFRSRYDDQLQQFLHPAGLVFVTPSGTVSSYLMGVGYTPADIRAGVLRARDGVLAAASPILLLCLHYDPATGRYSLAIMKLLRLAGAITVVTLGGVLLLAHRRGGRMA
jgi:protein SCO1/2